VTLRCCIEWWCVVDISGLGQYSKQEVRAKSYTMIESLLSRRKMRVRGEDAAVDGRGKAVLSRWDSRVFCTRPTAAGGPPVIGFKLGWESPGITFGGGSSHGIGHS
jgi:hypothetical protein